jgi:hypothetical protein
MVYCANISRRIYYFIAERLVHYSIYYETEAMISNGATPGQKGIYRDMLVLAPNHKMW